MVRLGDRVEDPDQDLKFNQNADSYYKNWET